MLRYQSKEYLQREEIHKKSVQFSGRLTYKDIKATITYKEKKYIQKVFSFQVVLRIKISKQRLPAKKRDTFKSVQFSGRLTY